MRIFSLARYAVGSATVLAILAACGAGTGLESGVGSPAVQPANRSDIKSYMLPQARSAKYLLYASSFFFGAVHVFDLKKDVEVGTIAGFTEPTGQCVDAKGDVWIALADPYSVVEYPRASLREIRSLHTDGRPFGCSVAPNGDLAVANFDQRDGSPGNVDVFKNASGSPTKYTCSGLGYYLSPGYDNNGNLFVEAWVSLGQTKVGVCMLPAGGNTLAPASINVALHYGGGAMWDGKYMTLTDRYDDPSFRYSTLIYRVTVSGSGGLTVVGKTLLLKSNISQPFLLGSKNTPVNQTEGPLLVGPDNYHVTEWSYPSGKKRGVPFVMVPSEVPFGESISIGT
jgi:hypothetical protein